MQHHNLYLSIGSLIGSAMSYLLAFALSSYVMGILGFIALLVSITAGFLTIKEKRMSIRFMKRHNKF